MVRQEVCIGDGDQPMCFSPLFLQIRRMVGIAFAAAFEEEVVGVSVLETPEKIMEMAR